MKNVQMELLRETINSMLVSKPLNDIELLKTSQDLDKIILEEMKEQLLSKTELGGEYMKEFEAIIDKLMIFEKMYQSMRIVDPIKKKVLEIKENEVCESDEICHDFWQRQIMCENCISMRAYEEDDAIFKMEKKDDTIYMLTAVPVLIQGRKLVIELLKDVTNSLYYGADKPGNEVRILSTIEYMNQAIVRDELTDLYNRRYINEKLPTDLLHTSVQNEPLSIIFADIDYFKSVNDTYGHSAGDQVLRDFAVELKKHIREGKDWAARYGGEEFMICLPNTDINTAKAIAERIRIGIMEKEFKVGENKIHMTCSFGVHTISDDKECLTIDGLIDLADKKLYKAKSEGRNRVV